MDQNQRIRSFLVHANNGSVEEFRHDMDSLPLDVTSNVYDGRSALHLASMNGHKEIVVMIMEFERCSIDVVNAKDRCGLTPLHLALRGCSQALARRNRRKPPTKLGIWRARIKSLLLTWFTRFVRFLEARATVDPAAQASPLPADPVTHDSIESGQAIHDSTESGPATHDSTESYQVTGQEEIVGLFSRSSLVLPDRLTRSTGTVDELGFDCAWYTPFHYPALRGNMAVMRLLLQQQMCCRATGYEAADIHATTLQGETALYIAKRHHDDASVVDFLECIDVQRLRAEFDRTANSQNTTLVGAALFAGISFGCWLQPPLGVPDPDSDSNPRQTPELRSKNVALFFVMIAPSLVFSLMALMMGIHAIIPSRGLPLRTEVHQLRKSVHRTAILLFLAITFLAMAAHIASVLVFMDVAYFDGWFSDAGELIVQKVSFLGSFSIISFVLASKRVFGWKTRAIILVTATSFIGYALITRSAMPATSDCAGNIHSRGELRR